MQQLSAVFSPPVTIPGQPTMPPRPTSARTPALVYWRTQRALTQRELSERVGVDLRTIQRLERGSPGQLPTIRRLAEALDVTPADLQRQPPEA